MTGENRLFPGPRVFRETERGVRNSYLYVEVTKKLTSESPSKGLVGPRPVHCAPAAGIRQLFT
jgi:hypothetical protein